MILPLFPTRTESLAAKESYEAATLRVAAAGISGSRLMITST